MKRTLLAASLLYPLAALAQDYPSPTLRNASILGTLNVTGNTSLAGSLTMSGTTATGIGSGIGQLAQFTDPTSAGLPRLRMAARLVIDKGTPAASDFATLQVNRTTSFSGGSGTTAYNLAALSTIGASDQTKSRAIIGQLNTSQTAGNAVAEIAQTNRLTGSTVPVWASVQEITDQTGLASSGVSGAAVTTEIDLRANKADDGSNSDTFGGVGQRKALQIVMGRYNSGDLTATTFSNALWITTALSPSGDDTLSSILSPIGFKNGMQIIQALDTRGPVAQTGYTDPVAAVRMSAGQIIDFKGGAALNSAAGRYLTYNSGSTKLQYMNTSATELFSISDAGNATFSGTGTFTGTLTGNGSVVAGGSSAGKITLSANTMAMATGQSLTLNMGGNASTYTIAGTGGTGNLVRYTASSTQNVIDFTTATGNLLKAGQTFISPGTITYSGAFSDTAGPFSASFNAAGSPTATANDFYYYSWRINSDVATVGDNAAILFRIAGNYGGNASMTGGRSGLFVNMSGSSPNGNASAGINPFYEGIRISVRNAQNEGGTGTTNNLRFGHGFGAIAYARLETGATNWYANVGMQANTKVATGASVSKEIGFLAGHDTDHVNPGTVLSAAFVAMSATGPQWGNILHVGTDETGMPLATTGTVIKATMTEDWAANPWTTTGGIDLNDITFTGNLISARDGAWQGDGKLRIGTAIMTPAATGMSIDTTGVVGLAEGTTISGGTLVSGGSSGFSLNTVLRSPYGGVYKVTGALAGVVTQLTVYRRDYTTGSPSTTVSLTPPANFNTTGTVQFTQTWTSGSLLTLQPSGGNTRIGTGSALATNAAAGFPLIPTMAGAPTGTVGAAGQAAVVIDTTNKKLCYSIGGGTWECSAAFTP